MIDHVSIPVSNLQRATAFYQAVLAELGMSLLACRETTAGFGKQYPEFWLNERPLHAAATVSDGAHVCLRASCTEQVDAFHRQALAQGGSSHGAPGFRRQYSDQYYAAFIQDPDGNRIEAVTFVR